MAQNRNKLIDLFIGSISNSIVHNILEKAIAEEIIRNHYHKELAVSLDIAKRYREKINPKNSKLPERDIEYIRNKIIKTALAELKTRVLKGYKNIDLGLVESSVDKLLRDTQII